MHCKSCDLEPDLHIRLACVFTDNNNNTYKAVDDACQIGLNSNQASLNDRHLLAAPTCVS